MSKKLVAAAAALLGVGVVAGIAAVLLRTDGHIVATVVEPGSDPTADGAPPADDPQLGRNTYVRCQACHGLDGKGVPGNYPPLAGSALLTAGDPAPAIRLVLRGVTRSAHWNGYMPPFDEQLTDAEIAAVLGWTRQQWGNAAPAVAVGDVTAARGR